MIMPRTRAHDFSAERLERARQTALLFGLGDGLRETKTAGGYGWAKDACAQANQASGSGCSPSGGLAGGCQTVAIGYPQGAAAGVVATTAQGAFVMTAPQRMVPYQLILGGTAQAFQVISFFAGLMGPLLAGTAVAPLSGDLFGANVQEPVPLKAVWIDAGVTLNLTLLNPTLNNLTFVGTLKVVLG